MAGIKLLPSRFPVSCTAGDDVTITLDVNDHLGANYSWTGATVVAPIVGHPTVTGFTVNATVDGTLVLSLTDAQTTALGADAGFEWSLSVTTAAATRTWCSGALSVSRPGRPGVTNTTTGTLTVAESTGTAVTIEVGAVGPAGVGVEAGGTTGQVLTKSSNTDYDTEWSTPAGGGDMLSSANLSDLADAATARTNLGLGSAAVLASTAFDAAGAASTAQAAAVATAAADATSKANAAAAAAIAASQPLDADLSALAAAGNSAVLAATTASFLTADETKLDGIEAGATADQSAAEILAALLTVDGTGSGLDADLLDGQSSAAFATSGHTHTGVYEAVGVAAALVDDLSGVSDATTARTNLGLGTAATTAASAYATAAQGTTADAALPKIAGGASVENVGAIESNVNTVAASGATETLDTSLYGVHDVTMDQSCTFTFSNPAPSGKATIFTLILRGAFTPTWPASVDWPDATPPTYTTPSLFVFTTVDGGTTYFGSLAGKAYG